VVKIPKWQFEKFAGADTALGTQMKSVGEVMAIGRTFKEALQKGIRSLEPHAPWRPLADTPVSVLREKLATPRPDRIHWLLTALERGLPAAEVCELTKIDPWFIRQMEEIAVLTRRIAGVTVETAPRDLLHEAKRSGFGDEQLAQIWKTTPAAVRHLRAKLRVSPVFKRVDTCAAEFESFTPYLYSTYEDEDEADSQDRPKIAILGSGPNRLGQGIEFDYCCCHASFALREDGYETVMLNCNPETVSTDYDTTDRLYFEPLTLEDVFAVYEHEASGGAPLGVIGQFGGRAMVIAYDEDTVIRYMKEAVEYSQDRPVLIDHFLEDAIEVDVDALSDGEDVVIAGIMQHIEEAGIHSGDSSCVLPAVDIP